MTDQKVLNEIEKAILEENEKELETETVEMAEKADTNNAPALPKYLTDNTVLIPLNDFLSLYQQAQILDRLVTLLLENSELNCDKDALSLVRYAPSGAICSEIKTYFPREYAERFYKLLNEEE